MRRRHILKGVGGIGAVLAVSQPALQAQGIEIEITRTNDPVQAGDFLDVEAEVTNTTGSDQRPTLEFYVGDERRITKILTVPAGETTTVDFGHLTYPVRQDVTFPVTVQTENTTVERDVEVHGIAELDDAQTSPASELTITPGTSVLFELESDALGAYGGQTHWYLEDGYAGQSMGPWNAAYYDVRGADHWRRTFTEEGTYGVAAALRGDDANYTARWTIHVTADADDGPTIESASPDPGPLEVSSSESVDLEATVAAPAGLDRAVWWLGHADVVLGTETFSGTEATTSLTADGLCHGCPIVLWVIDERGTVTQEDLWTPRVSYDGRSQLSITGTNAPVEAGGDLEVSVDVSNPGDDQLDEVLELVVGDEVVDTQSVTLEPNATEAVTLGYATYPVGRDVEFSVQVRSEVDRDSTTVDVFAEVGPAEIAILDANDPVAAGDRLEVEAEVTNTHDATITDVIHLVAGDRVDSASVTLEPDESDVLTLGYDTYPVGQDVEFPIEVVGDGYRDSRTVQVFADETPPVDVTITGASDPVAPGEFLEVFTQVSNRGDTEVTEDVSLIVGGEHVDGETVTIEPERSTQVVLGYDTYPVQRPVEFAVTVESNGVSDQRTVRVSPDAGDDPDDTDEDDPDEEDDDADEDDDPEAGPVTVAIDQTNAPVEGGEHLSVVANLANNGTAETTQTVELVVSGEVVDTESVTVPGEATQIVDLGYDTYPVGQDVSFEVVVRTDDDSAATTVEVFGNGDEDPDDGDPEEPAEPDDDQEEPDEEPTEADDPEPADEPTEEDGPAEDDESESEDEPAEADETDETTDETESETAPEDDDAEPAEAEADAAEPPEDESDETQDDDE